MKLALLTLCSIFAISSAAATEAPNASDKPAADEESLNGLFEDGKMPTMEEMQEQFKKIFGEDFDISKLMGEDGLDGAQDMYEDEGIYDGSDLDL